MQEMEQRVNVQLVEQHPHYYQGATISEIEDGSETTATATGSTTVVANMVAAGLGCSASSVASVNAATASTVASVATAATVVRASASSGLGIGCTTVKQEREQAFTSPGISSSSSVSALAASASSVTSAQVQLYPQAVQASPVLVLHDTDQRHRLRQKALVDSVESKV